METHSSILAWRIPRTEKPGGATVHGVTQSWTRLKRLSTVAQNLEMGSNSVKVQDKHLGSHQGNKQQLYTHTHTHTHTHAHTRTHTQKCVCMLLFVVQLLSRVQLFTTPWIIVHQAPLSMGFSRQEYWSGLSFPPPGDLFYPRIKTPTSPALAGEFFTAEPPGKFVHMYEYINISQPSLLRGPRGKNSPLSMNVFCAQILVYQCHFPIKKKKRA